MLMWLVVRLENRTSPDPGIDVQMPKRGDCIAWVPDDETPGASVWDAAQQPGATYMVLHTDLTPGQANTLCEAGPNRDAEPFAWQRKYMIKIADIRAAGTPGNETRPLLNKHRKQCDALPDNMMKRRLVKLFYHRWVKGEITPKELRDIRLVPDNEARFRYFQEIPQRNPASKPYLEVSRAAVLAAAVIRAPHPAAEVLVAAGGGL